MHAPIRNHTSSSSSRVLEVDDFSGLAQWLHDMDYTMEKYSTEQTCHMKIGIDRVYALYSSDL